MAIELDEWLKSGPEAPDLEEAPEGWHKVFRSFTICGEGECIKTLFTIYSPGKPRRGSIDLDRAVVARIICNERPAEPMVLHRQVCGSPSASSGQDLRQTQGKLRSLPA